MSHEIIDDEIHCDKTYQNPYIPHNPFAVNFHRADLGVIFNILVAAEHNHH